MDTLSLKGGEIAKSIEEDRPELPFLEKREQQKGDHDTDIRAINVTSKTRIV